MSLECAVRRDGDTVVVTPQGDVDVVTSALLRQTVQQILDRRECARLDIDMTHVTFLDSTGLGMLVAAQRAATAQGVKLWLRRPGPMVRMLLEVTNLYERLVPAEDRDATGDAEAAQDAEYPRA